MTVTGAQGTAVFEVLLEPAGLVVADQLRVDAFRDDLGAERAGGSAVDAPVEGQRHLGRAAYVEMVTDDALEEGSAGGGPSNTRVSEISNC